MDRLLGKQGKKLLGEEVSVKRGTRRNAIRGKCCKGVQRKKREACSAAAIPQERKTTISRRSC